MKRNEIVDRLADKGYTKKSARLIIDDVVRVIAEALVDGEEVSFRGFGTFYVKDVAPRETYDYQSKGRITIPAHKAPKFSPGNLLTRWVREGIIRE